MPLLVSVADAEYTGFPVSLPFFSRMKQDLGDRIKYALFAFRNSYFSCDSAVMSPC